MKIYIDKAFLYWLRQKENDGFSYVEESVFNFLNSATNKDVYLNHDSATDFLEHYWARNLLSSDTFTLIPLQEFDNLKGLKVLFIHDLPQDLVLDKNTICFTPDNLEVKFSKYLQLDSINFNLANRSIIEFTNQLDQLPYLPTYNLVITDPYILKEPYSIEHQIAPFIKDIIDRFSESNDIPITIFSDTYLRPKKDQSKYDKSLHKDDSDLYGIVFKMIKNQLNIDLIEHIKIDVPNNFSRVKYHDRMIISDSFILEVGCGFNYSTLVNSSIRISSLFNPDTYNRVNFLLSEYADYAEQTKNFNTNNNTNYNTHHSRIIKMNNELLKGI